MKKKWSNMNDPFFEKSCIANSFDFDLQTDNIVKLDVSESIIFCTNSEHKIALHFLSLATLYDSVQFKYSGTGFEYTIIPLTFSKFVNTEIFGTFDQQIRSIYYNIFINNSGKLFLLNMKL